MFKSAVDCEVLMDCSHNIVMNVPFHSAWVIKLDFSIEEGPFLEESKSLYLSKLSTKVT
jgi:hypothetical protein